MLREYDRAFRGLAIFLDLCIVAGSFFLGYFATGKARNVLPLNTYTGLLPLLVFLWGSLLSFFGMYSSIRTKQIPDILLIIFKTTIVGFVIFGSFTYVFRITDISRILIVNIFIITADIIGIEKIILLLFLRYTRKKGFNFRNILIVGTNKRAQHFMNLVTRHVEWGFKIIGFIDEDVSKVGDIINGYKVMGSFKEVPEVIHNHVVDEVVFVIPRSWLNKIEEIIYFCEMEGLRMHLAVDHFELKLSRAKQTNLYGLPFLTFESTPDELGYILLKRLLDIVISATALIVLLPFFPIVAIIIKATSKGPVFFKQQRCSLNGRKFMLYKLRTMVEGSEMKLCELLCCNEMNGPVFKMSNDPRVTKVGRFLRRFSIDELPQLWNVLKGDMSLVGPRPPIPTEVNKYDIWHRRRLSMRPGITCLWQVNGRNKITDFNEWAKLDLRYIDNWSPWLDFKILLKTIPVVLSRRGAN